jgi:hypothetical protein
MILRQRILHPYNSSPENSSLEKKFPGGGKFFSGAFSALTKNNCSEEFSGEELSERRTFRRRIIRQRIFLAKKYPSEEIS